ncbi:MAG: extracellular solute-binding protein [Chloroflexi bacterium]|nr:extracellular solute-binding protein [Chloroflexota bacterium]
MQYTRRQLVKSAAYLLGAFSSAALLEACSSPSPAAAPTVAPPPAQPTSAPAPTAASAAATTAPAPTSAPAAGAITGVTPAAEAAGMVAPKAARGDLTPGTIVIAISGGPEADAHTRLASKFTEYTKGKIQVRVEELPRGTPGTAKALTTLQGQSDAWDVLSVTSDNFETWGEAGFMAPLKTFIGNPDLFNAQAYNLDDFPKALLDIPNVKGEQIGFPQEASTLMFFYRKDLLKKYGIQEPGPKGYSWDELLNNALALKPKLAADGQTDMFPLVFGVKPTGHASIQTQNVIWSYGQEIFDEKWNPQLTSDKANQAMTMLTDFLFKHQVVSEGITGYEYPEVLTALQENKAVMALQWNAAAPTVLDASKSPAWGPDNTAFSVYPYGPGGPDQKRIRESVWAVCVSSFSKQQEAAFSYLAWFTSKDVARDYVLNGGGSSGRSSLLTDPDIVAKNPQYPAVLNGFNVLHLVPRIPEWSYISGSILDPDMSAIWSKQVSVADGLKKANDEIVNYLKDQGVL